MNKLFMLGLILAAIVLFFIIKSFVKNANHKSQINAFVKSEANSIPVFDEIANPFVHKWIAPETTQPVVDVASLKLDNGQNALVTTGAKGQHNSVLIYKDGAVQDIANQLGLEGDIDDAAYGITIADLNNNGSDDIIFSMNSGIYVYSKDSLSNTYKGIQMDIQLPDGANSVNINLADSRNTGHLDMYISTFISREKHVTANYNDPTRRVDNMYLENQGDGTFIDKTKESGLKLHQNSFESRWIDMNKNGLLDLVIATNTGIIRIYENLGNGKYRETGTPFGYGFWMGLAIADIDNDGYPEIFISNIGKTFPEWMLKRDLRPDQKIDFEFRLLKHNGDFKWRDISEEVGVKNKVFGWGAVFADFAGNGRYDLVSTENFIKFPLDMHRKFPNPGKLYIQGNNGKYIETTAVSNVKNPHFGYRTIATDFSGNGKLDLIIANIDGPLKIFLNNGKTYN